MKKSKKAVSLILAAIMALSVFTVVPFTVNAAEASEEVADYSSGDYEYEVLSNGTIEITAYTGSDTAIEIPSEIDGYTVTSIFDYALSDSRNIKSVTIPDSVTSIGGGAFYDCVNLESITIGSGVTSIGGDAFYGTAWYDNQPDGVVYIGQFAYSYKGAMPENTSIEIEEGITSIVDAAFENYENLVSITIPDSVTSIGDFAFYNCSNLE
ncbi:MAG: leucine-rich repeat domain-containing protein, partial [Clostridiales bacterium]|nr:leucine-rich repeat domain-containing protein [Clostridiales bacterium]